MRVVFFGTPAFAVPTLEALLAAGHEVVAVVTQPDRPRGRSHSTLLPSPVKSCALGHGIPVLQPDRPRGEAFLAALRDLAPDLGVVVAYGHILRPDLLAIPRLGMVNVHASLLPRWRGAAPIHWAILSGDRETGVSIMRMEAGLDSGPVWLQRAIPLQEGYTTGTLFETLAGLGAEALVEALPMIARGDDPVPQDESAVTLAPKVDRETARIDWSRPAIEVARLIRAMDPVPGAWTTFNGKTVKLYDPGVGWPGTTREDREHATPPPLPPPGTIATTTQFLTVACGDDWVQLWWALQEGRTRQHSDDWLVTRGYRNAADLPPFR